MSNNAYAMSVAEDCTRNLYQTQPEFFDCQNLEECNLRKKKEC